MTGLVRYEAACRALAEAKSIDEVKDIRDKAVAMAAYARQAKNKDLEADAVEIRMRATRRLDQLRQAQKESVGLAAGGQPYQSTGLTKNPVERPTLASQGIDKNLAHQARTLGSLSDEKFEEVVADARDAVSRAARSVMSADEKETRREDKLRLISANLPDQKYVVIYADPPWRFEPYSRETGMDRAADNHYPTMTLDGIKALPIEALAAESAVLFLWATAPMLPEALDVMAAWGFEYKSHQIWAKDRIGTGYWFRNKHELLLVGTRGSIPAPLMGTQAPSVITEPVGRHSEKPSIFRGDIAKLYQNVPKIELFSRSQHEGWDVWGNEVGGAAA